MCSAESSVLLPWCCRSSRRAVRESFTLARLAGPVCTSRSPGPTHIEVGVQLPQSREPPLLCE